MITSLLLTLLFTSVIKAIDVIPPTGTTYVGVWPDLSAGDTPAAFNRRLGFNAPVIQLAQSIPLPVYNYVTGAGGEALFTTADATNSDTGYYLTVYPDSGLNQVQDSDIVSLAMQILSYQSKGRTVYLRWAPEMNGIWNSGWGLMPTLYKSTWIRMYTIIKQIAPETVVVWSPNSSYGYPSGATLDSVVSAEDKAALDTNNDGVLSSADDAYSPYYPGDLYVDWAGVSLYYKGPGFQNLNEPQPGGYCTNVLLGNDPFYDVTYTPFYATYCTGTQPCMISESGAAYHVDVLGGSSQMAIQQAWWQDCITNSTFHGLFPEMRAIFMFEHAKVEYDGGVADLRDFRITNDTAIAAAFAADLATMNSSFTWATDLAPGILVATTAPASPVPTGTATISTTIASLTEAVTYTYTGFSTPLVDGEVAEPTATVLGSAPGTLATATLLPGAMQAARVSSASSIPIVSATGLALLLVCLAVL